MFQRRSGIYLAAVVLTLLAVSNVTVRYRIEGASMEPTLVSGQWVVALRSIGSSNVHARGDVVIFRDPDTAEHELIKRIIGLPGDTVELRDTFVYIDGQRLDEPYIANQCSIDRCPDSLWQLGIDEYFMMGDNREHSSDSRAFGTISSDLILGNVIFRYWPLSEIGRVG